MMNIVMPKKSCLISVCLVYVIPCLFYILIFIRYKRSVGNYFRRRTKVNPCDIYDVPYYQNMITAGHGYHGSS